MLAYYGASDYPLPIKRKYTSLVTTRSIVKSVCLTHLIQQIREQRIDLDATAEALHRTAGNTPPSKTTEARALMQPLMDIILTAIRDHAPAPKRWIQRAKEKPQAHAAFTSASPSPAYRSPSPHQKLPQSHGPASLSRTCYTNPCGRSPTADPFPKRSSLRTHH